MHSMGRTSALQMPPVRPLPADADDELLQIKTDLRRLRRQRLQCTQQQPGLLQNRLRGALKQFVLMLFVLARHDAAVAVSFLHGHGRKRQYIQEASATDTSAAVEWLFIHTQQRVLVNLFDAREGNPVARIARAGFYAVEHHLFQWVLQHNCLRGIAPTTGQLLREAQLCIPQDLPLSARERMLQMFLSSPSRSKRWASRWRGRWGARFGKMCTGCPMSTEELRKRVPGAKTCRLLKSRATQAAEKTSPQPMFPGPLCHHFSDPHFGPHTCRI
jgi:hypothetical protein